MTKPRTKFEVSYRVLDESGHTLEIIKEQGYNKNYIEWSVGRKVKAKYGKDKKLHRIKIQEIKD